MFVPDELTIRAIYAQETTTKALINDCDMVFLEEAGEFCFL